MLEIVVKDSEFYNNQTEEFIYIHGCTLQLEHSLLSLSKWESKWHKPFLNNNSLNKEEFIDYVRCMTINKNVDPNVYLALTKAHANEIDRYIHDEMTATTIQDHRPSVGFHRKEVITAELIYYWMITYGIPFECQKWHLNRLITLIRVCSVKAQSDNKMSSKEAMANQRALNAARKKKMNTRG